MTVVEDTPLTEAVIGASPDCRGAAGPQTSPPRMVPHATVVRVRGSSGLAGALRAPVQSCDGAIRRRALALFHRVPSVYAGHVRRAATTALKAQQRHITKHHGPQRRNESETANEEELRSHG